MARAPSRLTVAEEWFNRLVVGAVAFGFLLLVIAGSIAAVLFVRNQDYAQWVAHTYQVQVAIVEADSIAYRLETGRRGLLLRDEPTISRTFRENAARMLPAVDHVLRLTRDNPRQQRDGMVLRNLSENYLAWLQRSVDLCGSGRRDQAVADFRASPQLELATGRRDQAARMLAEEGRLLVIRDVERRDSATLFYALLSVAGVLLLGVGIASVVVILRYTRDLTASRNRLRELNENLEGAVRERTVDLQRANDEIQRFAYIVSHDLRSPLVNVMGFTAELEGATKRLGGLIDRVEREAPQVLDDDTRMAAREDLPEAIGFIRTSTQKMDRLINAILRLSREGRRTIMPERIDMAAMAKTVADSLRHRADELGATISVEGSLPSIVSDRLAVEQVLSNLVENAVKYLKPGRPGVIRIRGRIGPNGRAKFEVVDNGRGIDPRDHERVFDLFRRSGVQDQPGEGIGLAHVRAMAYRLGGTITVESTLGEGATFRVNLPLTYSAEQGIAA